MIVGCYSGLRCFGSPSRWSLVLPPSCADSNPIPNHRAYCLRVWSPAKIVRINQDGIGTNKLPAEPMVCPGWRRFWYQFDGATIMFIYKGGGSRTGH